jgi:hypothetical protein
MHEGADMPSCQPTYSRAPLLEHRNRIPPYNDIINPISARMPKCYVIATPTAILCGQTYHLMSNSHLVQFKELYHVILARTRRILIPAYSAMAESSFVEVKEERGLCWQNAEYSREAKDEVDSWQADG